MLLGEAGVGASRRRDHPVVAVRCRRSAPSGCARGRRTGRARAPAAAAPQQRPAARCRWLRRSASSSASRRRRSSASAHQSGERRARPGSRPLAPAGPGRPRRRRRGRRRRAGSGRSRRAAHGCRRGARRRRRAAAGAAATASAKRPSAKATRPCISGAPRSRETSRFQRAAARGVGERRVHPARRRVALAGAEQGEQRVHVVEGRAAGGGRVVERPAGEQALPAVADVGPCSSRRQSSEAASTRCSVISFASACR